jgi:hypothetical protein
MPGQRNVVEVDFKLPSGGSEKHPVIVLTNDEINTEEGGFVAVMMTSQDHYRDDLYSFELNDAMFTKPLGKPFSAVRLHLIGNFNNSEVIPNSFSGNQMRLEPFKRMLTQIRMIAFTTPT